jgi:hypothetical protein
LLEANFSMVETLGAANVIARNPTCFAGIKVVPMFQTHVNAHKK